MVLFIGNRQFQSCGKRFRKRRRTHVFYFDWLENTSKGSNRNRFEHRKNSNDVLLHVRVIQGHSGIDLIASELMNHVAIPSRWKEFLYHRRSSFNVNCTSQAGLIASGKDTREGRQTVFFSPFDILGTKQKKNSTMICRGREKCFIKVNGSLIKTPSTGSTWPGHKKNDCSFGRQILTPLSFTIQCQPDCITPFVLLSLPPPPFFSRAERVCVTTSTSHPSIPHLNLFKLETFETSSAPLPIPRLLLLLHTHQTPHLPLLPPSPFKLDPPSLQLHFKLNEPLSCTETTDPPPHSPLPPHLSHLSTSLLLTERAGSRGADHHHHHHDHLLSQGRRSLNPSHPPQTHGGVVVEVACSHTVLRCSTQRVIFLIAQ